MPIADIRNVSALMKTERPPRSGLPKFPSRFNKKDPELARGLFVLIEAGSLVRCLAQIESVVHADQDGGRGRFGIEATTKFTDRTGERGD